MLQPVVYTFNDISIPPTFLADPPLTAITTKHIDFASSPLPKNAGRIALVLENVLSKEECQELLRLAEASVPVGNGESPWRPALVSAGPGLEGPAPGYRESDRIIWDQQQVVDLLWARCSQAEGLKELLATVPGGPRCGKGHWQFRRFNNRMRFLKYSPGQFFKRMRSSMNHL